jgi:hypothetical protein
MLTILSDTQVRLLADSIKTIEEQLGELRSVLETSQTVNFEVATEPVVSPAPRKQRESQVKTRASRRKRGYKALNAGQVLEIKRRLAAGEGASPLSREFKVHLSTVNAIKWGKTWKHVSLQQAEAVSV